MLGARTLLVATVLLAGCSTLPEATYPPFADHHVDADFVVPAAGRFRFPASSPLLVVHELGLEPAPVTEQFGRDGERWLVYPAGTEVHARCRFRVYAGPDGRVPGVEEVLTGARSLRAVVP